jgi:hypothetical protein
MHGLTKVALLVASLGMSVAAHAVDRGQFGDVPDHVRKWFKSVIAPNGVPCGAIVISCFVPGGGA